MTSRKQIEQLLAAYFTNKLVLSAYLFSSYSRGEEKTDSDVDVLVELDYANGGASYDNWCDMQDDLTAMLYKKVDLVSAQGLSKYIAPHIHASKQLVYEQA